MSSAQMTFPGATYMTVVTKSDLDNRANQLNPICVVYYLSRGLDRDRALKEAIAVRKTHQPPSECKQFRRQRTKPA